MSPATISTSTIELRRTSNNVLVTATVTYNATSRTATLTPTAVLVSSTGYTIRVLGGATDPRVKDLAGNALATTFSSSFTTGTASDTTAPTVSSVNPANGAAGVATNATVAVTFNEPMNPSTSSSSTIVLRRTTDNTPIPSRVSYNTSTRVASLTPASALAASTNYTVQVLGGATDPRVKNLAGLP